jgi:hypothetical protein
MTRFKDDEQNAVDILVAAAVKMRHAMAFAAKVGIRLQLEYPNVQLPSHLGVSSTTPMRVGTEGLWVDVEMKSE